MSDTVHSKPWECGPDHSINFMCVEGTVYAPCESEYCYGSCQPAGDCDCSCHATDTGGESRE